MLGLGAVVLTAVVAGSALATGVLNLRGISGEPGGSTSAPPSAAVSVPPTATQSPMASASAEPSPDLTMGMWVEVVTDVLPVYASPALDAPVIDTTTLGQLVYVLENVETSADGVDWFEVMAMPSVRGWVTGAGEETFHLNLDSAAGTVEWCAIPTARVYREVAPAHIGEPHPLVELGNVPVPSSFFSPAALGTADLAWADGTKPVCAVLEVVDGDVVSAAFHADVDICARAAGNAYGWAMYFGSRVVQMPEAVLGYSPMDPGWRNADLIVYLAGAGYGGGNTLLSCIKVIASGDIGATEMASTVRADVCATVISVDEHSVVLRGIEPWGFVDRDAEFIVHPGSEVDPAIEPGATLGMRIESDDGLDGALRIAPVSVPGC